MDGQDKGTRGGFWRRLALLLVGLPMAATLAVAEPGSSLGEMMVETAKGAAGGAFVGVVIVLARHLMG